MKFNDLVSLWNEYRKRYGVEAYRYISDLFVEAKEHHKRDFDVHPTPGKDHGQSWKPFKGHALEKLIVHIIKDEVTNMGLSIVDGNRLEKTKPENLSKELSSIKRSALVDYGEFGYHLPDLDIIIYDPNTLGILAAVSSKVTLRERIAQTGYWKTKLAKDKMTKHIKIYFVTLDEDHDLTIRRPAKKGRAVVEVDTDGAYVMTRDTIEESDKVKAFDKFLTDLRTLINR